MSDLVIKSGDRYETVWRIPGVHLQSETVRLVARRGFNAPIILPTTIEGGAVVHMLDGSMDVTGEYSVELEITNTDDSIITAPSASYFTIRVIADLD
jgi:hypothetical protein